MEALIIDALRTPRGRGKSSGSLATVTPVELACHPLRALKARHDLNEDVVDEEAPDEEVDRGDEVVGEEAADGDVGNFEPS